MDNVIQEIEVAIQQCVKCAAEINQEEKFCGECGWDQSKPLKDPSINEATSSAKKKKSIKRLSQSEKRAIGKRAQAGLNRKERVRKDAIKQGRIAIMVVAVLTIVLTLIQWINFENQVTAASNNPMQVIDQNAVAQARLIIYSTFGCGLLFVGLFVWAKKNPFSACLTALVIYVLSHVVSAVIDPATIYLIDIHTMNTFK